METSWQTVWAAIDARRIALGWSKADLYRETKTSEATYRKMATGDPGDVRRDRRVAICQALLWTPDSIERLLGGGAAAEVEASSMTGRLEQRLDDLEAEVRELRRRLDALSPVVAPEQFATAAEGASGRPPKSLGRPVSRPTPPADDGDHIEH